MAIASLILQPGTTLGGYRIEDVVGIGGMAVVYRAEQLTLGRRVALKVLSPELSRDPVFRERFRREGQHVAALEHPNIIPIYDADEADGRLYLATRLIEGQTLAERMVDGGVSADEMLAILGPIADALDTAHDAGVIHRDVKPQNILLTAKGEPFLADFGVAKSATGHGLTATGGFLGSVSYASPEQIRGETLTSASDIYSLTAIAYQCLTGRVPYPRDTDASVMHAHLSEPPPALPAAAGRLQGVIAGGMAKLPEHRPTTATALLTELERGLAAHSELERRAVPAFPPHPSAAATPPSRVGEMTIAVDATVHDRRREAPVVEEAPEPRSRRALWIGLAAAAVVVVVATGLGFAFLGSSDGVAATPTVRSGALEISYGSGWSARPGTAPVTIAGLQLARPVVMTDRQASDVTLRVGGLAKAGNQAGALPTAALGAFATAPRAQAARVDGLLGSRYRGRLKDGTLAQLWIAPTTAGQFAIACTVQTSSLTTCDRAVSAARLLSGRGLPTGPDRALAPRITAALAPVASAHRVTALHKHDLTARARAARRLAAGDRAAARSLRAARAGPIDARTVAGLASALSAEARPLSALAAATGRRDRAAYTRAKGRLRAAARRVQAGAARVRRHGYAVATLATPIVPALPRPRVHHHRRTARVVTAPAPTATVTPATPQQPVTPTPTYTPPPARAKRKSSNSGDYGPIVVAPAQ